MKLHRGLVWLLGGLCCAISSLGSAQQSATVALPSRLAPATRSAILALADSMRAAGLPVDPLYDRTAEGVLKGADDARILMVVRALAGRLRDARALLGETASTDALVAAAAAVGAGVPADCVRRAAAARPDAPGAPSISLVLGVLTDLVGQQVIADAATASLESLLKRGARDQDLVEFEHAIERDIRTGKTPKDAATLRTESTLRVLQTRGKPPDA